MLLLQEQGRHPAGAQGPPDLPSGHCAGGGVRWGGVTRGSEWHQVGPLRVVGAHQWGQTGRQQGAAACLLGVLPPPLVHAPPPCGACPCAAGTGQHSAHFAAGMPHLNWQPTEYSPDCFARWGQAPRCTQSLSTLVAAFLWPEPVVACKCATSANLHPSHPCRLQYRGVAGGPPKHAAARSPGCSQARHLASGGRLMLRRAVHQHVPHLSSGLVSRSFMQGLYRQLGR